jgi:CubicO group peptidase (beta-lactamase class C family)
VPAEWWVLFRAHLLRKAITIEKFYEQISGGFHEDLPQAHLPGYGRRRRHAGKQRYSWDTGILASHSLELIHRQAKVKTERTQERMREKLSRRSFARNLLGAAAGGMVPSPVHRMLWAQGDRPTGMQRGGMGRLAGAFKSNFRVPALSVAISRNGQFVFDQGFGMADSAKLVQANMSTLFRIASVTKPITSVTIFTLIEKGKLNLTDKVFGPSGILGTKYGKSPYKQYVADITVDNLLTHTCGGWPSDSTDPMFRFNSWDQAKLIAWTLENLPLTYPPGQHWDDSNFGYCVLGRVIEQVTGQPYADYVQSNILAPCGISNMRIAGNTLRQRAASEVVYFGQYDEDPYKMNVARMDSDGGWLATPSSLVQFLDHVAGSGNIPSILRPESIRTMTTPSPAFSPSSPARYARGWMVGNDGLGNWWHSGSLPGSTTIMVRTATGMCWAALANTRTEPHAQIDAALDQMMWGMARSVPNWGA